MNEAQSKVIPMPQDRLEELEEKIANGLSTFRQVGSALAEIQDLELYKSAYKTFEAYCAARWGIKRRRAYQMMDAHRIAALLPESVQNFAQKENQIRELSKANPADRASILESVSAAGPVTAKAIRQEIARRNPQPEPVPQIKPARVIQSETVEQTFVDDSQNQIQRGPVDIVIAQIRALADNLEEDYCMPVPGEELDCDKYAERLTELARLVRKLKEVV